MASKPNSGEHETELDITTLRTGPVSSPVEVAKDERVDAALGIFSDLKSLEVTPTTSVGAHEILSTIPDPRWPDRPFPELLAIGFRNLTIDSEDHGVIKAMRGLTV